MKKELICITCPRGCRITVTLNDRNEVESVTGNTCGRGEKYARSECTYPVRMLTSTVRLTGSDERLLPVVSSVAMPKDLIMEAMRIIRTVQVPVPVKAGQIIVKNILDSGVDIVASCSAK